MTLEELIGELTRLRVRLGKAEIEIDKMEKRLTELEGKSDV